MQTGAAEDSDPVFDFRDIADSAPALIWVSNKDKAGVWFNRTWLEFTGGALEEELGDGWLSRICPEDMDAIQECVSAFAEKRPFRTEFRLRRADGTYRWMIDTGVPRFRPDGTFIGFVGSMVEIEDKKQGEEQLRVLNETLEAKVAERTRHLSEALERVRVEAEERAALEEALRQARKIQALGQLTGGIAHDFNNLLTPIIGGLDLVRRLVDDPAVTPILETAIRSARRGADLTKQLLTFSRMQKLDVRPVDVDEVLGRSEALLSRTLGPQISIEAERGAGVRVLADPTQLELALLNLAINARDAMPNGGTLRISAEQVEARSDPELLPGAYVRLEVTDTGIGMDAEVQRRAFEPFFTTKETGAGTGLGLSSVYGFARQCGGTARLRSAPGEGTTVYLFLPLTDEDRAGDWDGELDGSGYGNGGSAKILVVDDDDEVRQFVASCLGHLGHQVLATADARGAIEMIAEQKPDLIITDYAMPGMTGAELARAAREHNPRQKIIFISGFADGEALSATAGDAILVTKPFGMGDLYKAIEKTLQG